MSVKPAYAGEAMLLRWSETPKGRTVTLLLDPHIGEQHPFKNLKCGENGQRMQLAAVLVGDDEQPAPPPKGPVSTQNTAVVPPVNPAQGQEKPERTPFRDLPRSQQAALKIRDPEFQEWLRADGAAHADLILKSRLNIVSKRELDDAGGPAGRWDEMMTNFDYRHALR